VSRTRSITIVLLVALVAAVLPSFAAAQQAEQRQLQQARDRLASLAQDLDQASSEAQVATRSSPTPTGACARWKRSSTRSPPRSTVSRVR
jgi:type II secretory pathway pseudopilin PulG